MLKRIFSIDYLRDVAFIAGFFVAALVSSAAAAEPLTVMSWNLEWFFDDFSGDNYSDLAKEQSAPDRVSWDWKRDLVAKSIASVNPTIAALQEIEGRRVLWYLTRSLDREHKREFGEICIEGKDHFTEQDVGFLFRRPADLIMQTQFNRSGVTSRDTQFFDVTKHLLAVFDFPVGDSFERVTLLNVHLRSRDEGAPIRIRQARLIRQWLKSAIESGENVIVLGDINTEENAIHSSLISEMTVLTGRDTPSTDDDLVDLHVYLSGANPQTHILRGKNFDRILVSRSLIEDRAGVPDLVFKSIEIRSELNVQGEVDEPLQHWERYWEIPSNQRDLSDHHPVIATFEVK